MDQTHDEMIHRRKLRFRAWRRGFREMDLLMGSFADAHIKTLPEDELAAFEQLLDLPDWEVYAWLIGNKLPPEEFRTPLMDRLLAFRYEAQGG